MPFCYVLHNCSGLSLLPNQTGEVCFLLQHWACCQFVLSKLQSGVLKFSLFFYCWGPKSTKKLCHLFLLPGCSRPPLAWCSHAPQGQAAVGRAVCETCEEPCWKPPPPLGSCMSALSSSSVLVCAMVQVPAPAGYDPPPLRWSPFLLWGGREVMGSMAGPLQGAGRLSWHSTQRHSQAMQMPQAPSRSGHLIPRASATPSCLTHQHTCTFDHTIQFKQSAKLRIWGRRSPDGPQWVRTD